MAFGKKNVIKIDPLSYNLGLIGLGGIGKTTIIKEMCEKLAGGDGYLFLECGKEDGADAISGINYINCPDWNSEYDELTNSAGFNVVLEDILEKKATDYANLKVVVVDTYDQLREISVQEVIRLHNKEHSDKRVKSIKQAFGGYMAGEDMADDIILDKLWELKRVGVHFIIIGHTKLREVQVEGGTGETYVQLTTDMSMRSFNKIKTKLHFLGVASIDRDIVKEKVNGKEKGFLKGETRKITFRDDNFCIDSKSRFADIVPEIPMDADALIKALTDAIELEAKKGSTSMTELKKIQKEHDKKTAERAAKYTENKIDEDRNIELVTSIKKIFLDNKSNPEKADAIATVKGLIKDAGVSSMDELVDIPTAKLEEMLTALNS